MMTEKDAEQRKRTMKEYQTCAVQIKDGLHEAVADFDQVYPGQLTQALQAQRPA